MLETNELKGLQAQLNQLVDMKNPKELNEDILKRIKDITYLAALTLLIVDRKTSDKVRKIIMPLYGFLKSFHDETDEALKNPDYTFKTIDEPELPDMTDIDKDSRSDLKIVLDTIIKALPTLVDLATNLLHNNYPYAREVEIAVNTIQIFCDKYDSLL